MAGSTGRKVLDGWVHWERVLDHWVRRGKVLDGLVRWGKVLDCTVLDHWVRWGKVLDGWVRWGKVLDCTVVSFLVDNPHLEMGDKRKEQTCKWHYYTDYHFLLDNPIAYITELIGLITCGSWLKLLSHC